MKFREFEFPESLKYNEDYSWVRLEDDIAIVGVNDYGAKMVKQFVFVDLPEKNKEIRKGENYVTLEAIKWTGSLKSPVTGKIIDVNSKVFDNPELINKDPYGQGWIMKVKLKDKKELESLKDAKGIIEIIKRKTK
ncbi:MAG: glycine cleavage system H protein [Candidatus Woesearchaeota archaeon]